MSFNQSWWEERLNCLLFNPNILNLILYWFDHGYLGLNNLPAESRRRNIIEEWNSVPPIAARESKRRDSDRIIRVPSEIKSKLTEHGIKKTRSNTREDPRSSLFAHTIEPLTTHTPARKTQTMGYSLCAMRGRFWSKSVVLFLARPVLRGAIEG